NLSRISNFSPDYELHRHYMRVQPRSLKGVVRRHPEGGARRGVPRRRLATVAPGGRGPPPGTTTRMWEFAVTDPAAMPVRGSAAPAPKIATLRAPGGGRPPYGGARRLARGLACPDSAGPTDASQASVRLSALRPPPIGGRGANKQNPGAKKPPRGPETPV